MLFIGKPIGSNSITTQMHTYNKKEARKRLTESNGTPAMDFGHMNVVLKWCICILIFEVYTLILLLF